MISNRAGRRLKMQWLVAGDEWRENCGGRKEQKTAMLLRLEFGPAFNFMKLPGILNAVLLRLETRYQVSVCRLEDAAPNFVGI